MKKDKGREKRKGRLIPEGELKCVWMDAGIVSYKLCDYEYECERCPFDQIMRNNASESLARQPQPQKKRDTQTTVEKKETAKTSPEILEATDFDRLFQTFYDFKIKEKLYYHPGHTWIDVEGPQSVRIGLNEFIVKFLFGIKTIILPSAGNRVDRGHVFCRIVGEDGTLPITAPISGSVIASNRSVSKEPSLLMKSSYEQGWLMKIEPENINLDLKHPYGREEALCKCVDDLETLRENVEPLLKQNWETLGLTLFDGGRMLLHIRDIIGSKRYFNIINGFLSGAQCRVK